MKREVRLRKACQGGPACQVGPTHLPAQSSSETSALAARVRPPSPPPFFFSGGGGSSISAAVAVPLYPRGVAALSFVSLRTLTRSIHLRFAWDLTLSRPPISVLDRRGLNEVQPATRWRRNKVLRIGKIIYFY